MPRVSIIMPAYNRRNVVAEAIESCLAQTFQDLEVVVVDDGSTDGTADHVRETFAAEPRVRLLPLDANRGVANARNHGIANARGDLLGLLDTDDLYLPRFVEAHVRALDASPEVHMTISDARYEGAWPRKRPTVFARRAPPTSGAMMCEGAWIVPCCVMVRAEVLRHIPFERERRLLEDSELMFRFFEAGYRTKVVDEVLSVYRRLGSAAGEAQLASNRGATRLEALRLAEHYAHLAGDSRAHRLRLDRRWAKYHLAFGEPRQARRHAAAWWRKRPWDARAAWTWLRARLAVSGGPSATEG